MKKSFTLGIVCVGFILLLPSLSLAKIQKYNFEGSVDWVVAWDGMWDEHVTVGSDVRGLFTFDDTTLQNIGTSTYTNPNDVVVSESVSYNVLGQFEFLINQNTFFTPVDSAIRLIFVDYKIENPLFTDSIIVSADNIFSPFPRYEENEVKIRFSSPTIDTVYSSDIDFNKLSTEAIINFEYITNDTNYVASAQFGSLISRPTDPPPTDTPVTPPTEPEPPGVYVPPAVMMVAGASSVLKENWSLKQPELQPELKIYDQKVYNSNNELGAFIPIQADTFDATKETVVITHGWNGPGSAGEDIKIDDLGWIKKIADEIIKNKGDEVNVLVFDWTALSNSYEKYDSEIFVKFSDIYKNIGLFTGDGIEYGTELFDNMRKILEEADLDYGVPNLKVDEMAAELQRSIIKLFHEKKETNPGEIHFIGHSLGAAASAKAVRLIEEYEQDYVKYTNIQNLTLLDAPEDTLAWLAGGTVNLNDTISWISQNADDIFVQNIYGADKANPWGGYGEYYSGIFNVKLPLEDHNGVRDWYINTINPSDYDNQVLGLSVNGLPIANITTTTPNNMGFDKNNNQLHIFRDWVETIGDVLMKDVWFNDKSQLAQYVDRYKYLEAHIIVENRLHDIKIDYELYAYSKDKKVDVIKTEDGHNRAVAASPIFAYFETEIPEDVTGFKLDFFPEIWHETDLFTIWINNVLLYGLSGEYFSKEWFNTGFLDVSLWAEQNVVFTFGFLSDFTGNSILIGDASFIREGSAPVPEPATLLLFGAGLAGLAAVGRRRKS